MVPHRFFIPPTSWPLEISTTTATWILPWYAMKPSAAVCRFFLGRATERSARRSTIRRALRPNGSQLATSTEMATSISWPLIILPMTLTSCLETATERFSLTSSHDPRGVTRCWSVISIMTISPILQSNDFLQQSRRILCRRPARNGRRDVSAFEQHSCLRQLRSDRRG